jgi:LAS superfamily LD-carboxypeptidase LdcB
MHKKFDKKYLIFFVLATAIGLLGHLAYQDYRLGKENLVLENELFQTKTDFASTTRYLDAVVLSLERNLATTTAERNDFEQKYLDQYGRLNLLDVKVQGLQGMVSLLDKLQKTDKELLIKYSKIYFLNENYAPAALVKINSEYTYHPEKDYMFLAGAWPFFDELMSQAQGAGIDIEITSSYRSFDQQGQIKATHTMIYGSGANAFSADQGYSEHQLGTTVDFTTSKIGATFTGFEKTPAYQWLLDNAYKYGFVISYPEKNQYYEFEPWHWRFVGRDLAGFLHQQGKHFYDLDQREIDQYLVSIFN